MNNLSFRPFEPKDCEVLPNMIANFYRDSGEEIAEETSTNKNF